MNKLIDIKLLKKALTISSIFLFIYVNNVVSQNIQATAKLDATTIKIGDQVKLHLTVQRPSNIVFSWATPPDSLNGIEIVESSKVDTIGNKDSVVMTEVQTLTITSFDTGYYPIPPFVFHYKKDKDTNDYTIETQTLLLTVNGIQIDLAKDIKGIKPPLDAPFTFTEFWQSNKNYVFGGLGLIILIAGILIYFLRRKKVVPIFVEKIVKRPAHEIALESLQAVEKEKLWQNGFVKQYYSSLSDIIRTYIENRYNVIAMELTTDEILFHFNRGQINTEAKDKLTHLLKLADLVKFAKVQPLPNEHDLCLTDAYSFVEITRSNEEDIKPIEEPTPEN